MRYIGNIVITVKIKNILTKKRENKVNKDLSPKLTVNVIAAYINYS